MSEQPKCELCGEPMPAGEEMFKYHGYSGNCPKTPKVMTNESTDYADIVKRLREPERPLNADRREAAGAIETLVRERDEARAERDAADGIWPEWAQQILERLRDLGFQYDAEEEIQLPDDFISHVEGWLQATEDRYKARAEAAEAEVTRLREALKEILENSKFRSDMVGHIARAALEAK